MQKLNQIVKYNYCLRSYLEGGVYYETERNIKMITKICEAIGQKRVIEFQYDNRFRVVEPYCVGESSRGNVVLRAYQIDGESSSGNPIGWRLYDISKLSNLEITSRKFSLIQPDYNPNDRGMVKIICNL